MDSERSCACEYGDRLIYACSGAADVGSLADRTARWLHLSGWGKMHCLAGVGAGLDGIVNAAEHYQGLLT